MDLCPDFQSATVCSVGSQANSILSIATCLIVQRQRSLVDLIDQYLLVMKANLAFMSG